MKAPSPTPTDGRFTRHHNRIKRHDKKMRQRTHTCTSRVQRPVCPLESGHATPQMISGKFALRMVQDKPSLDYLIPSLLDSGLPESCLIWSESLPAILRASLPLSLPPSHLPSLSPSLPPSLPHSLPLSLPISLLLSLPPSPPPSLDGCVPRSQPVNFRKVGQSGAAETAQG